MTRKRVVLLARAGAACERTQASIAEAGAELVATLDPGSASEADVRAAQPDAVMVILDPVVEQALDNFDGVLGDPAFDVMFEDADVAAKREGWEAARWSRHLNAKLHGHDDVLPPVKDGSVAESSAAPTVGSRLSLEPKADVGTPIDSVFQQEMDALQRRVAAMPDVPHGNQDTAPSRQGAVVIAAGVGGPDAVRQLLGNFPTGFARPIVLRQRIEGGQYDKLVRQMQRATELRVVLAQAGDPLQAGTVHVLPDGLDLQAAPTGLVFAAVAGDAVFAALPPIDSALLLLSGADINLVDVAMSLSWAGGLALGQSPENCFDPAASNALAARGGQAASLAKLPAKLLERWPV
ncbi:chemotaxis protein CheB [Thermomonas sp.]|uniref:chemotaxis protein CheB n=1 Tax=Thermomonas sp. TaxID=1971895 RepID=UPI00248A3AE3|nr:chemotaxis protein CheB [Thermomonas sp.]MDI1254378.1 chemotaxis protein CheB [Thermomonas sp.]